MGQAVTTSTGGKTATNGYGVIDMIYLDVSRAGTNFVGGRITCLQIVVNVNVLSGFSYSGFLIVDFFSGVRRFVKVAFSSFSLSAVSLSAASRRPVVA